MKTDIMKYSSIISGIVFVLAAIFFGGAAIWASVLQQNSGSSLFGWGLLALLLMLLAEAGWQWSKKSWSIEAKKSVLRSGMGAASKIAGGLGILSIIWDILIALLFLAMIVLGAAKSPKIILTAGWQFRRNFTYLSQSRYFILSCGPCSHPFLSRLRRRLRNEYTYPLYLVTGEVYTSRKLCIDLPIDIKPSQS